MAPSLETPPHVVADHVDGRCAAPAKTAADDARCAAADTATPTATAGPAAADPPRPAVAFAAEPYAFSFAPRKAALLLVDMQRDFLLRDGFGHIQAGDGGVDAVQRTIAPALGVLRAFRALGLAVLHTREGHRADLRDCPTTKLVRQARAPHSRHAAVIGDAAPMGRLLTRGHHGHDFVDDLQPRPGEIVVDKPGKGSFFSTLLHEHLVDRGITHLVVAGVTVECCVTTTVREANDRGFDCCILRDCTDGFVPAFKDASLDMIHFSEGLFGFVADSGPLLDALAAYQETQTPLSSSAWDGAFDVQSLRRAYAAGLSPVTVVKTVLERIEHGRHDNPYIWINVAAEADLIARAEHLDVHRNLDLPLFGIPFAAKDNIDVAGLPTTAACPAFSYTPSQNATVIEKLLAAGAILIGKTNMDQFATGLVGVRSPYGACHSVYSGDHVSGGSSSGSAVAVALEQVTFALGTDTAGSGRVPAALNGIVGLKPSKGTVSTHGVVPACKTLDCVSMFAKSIDDAETAWLVAKGFDAADPYARSSRPVTALTNRALLQPEGTYTYALPSEDLLLTHLSPEYLKAFKRVQDAVRRLHGAHEVPFDFDSYLSASDLVYKGAHVAERASALRPFVQQPEKRAALLPITRQIFDQAFTMNAADAFTDLRRAREHTRIMETEFDKCDVVIMPTAPRHPTFLEVEKDPYGPNLEMGVFASAVNVLDLSAVAIPAGLTDGMPFGVSLVGPAFREGMLLEVARRLTALLA
ncbi:putative allophanate hydrolase protein [Neofusicoccum parvum UCRNP2]|uniref:Putative allophanate hydrolase protein n=1 Tax=Botryosphaeria parva (strain UCR-NP2) TaxID=1287680 RepID=R1GB45_BOTPV|nr:putative allophanate hydrolase protein [Neofusicoccum parvum UCRNP2]